MIGLGMGLGLHFAGGSEGSAYLHSSAEIDAFLTANGIDLSYTDAIAAEMGLTDEAGLVAEAVANGILKSDVLDAWGNVNASNNDFELLFNIAGDDETLTIPLQNYATNVMVDWGDGSTSEITSYDDADLAHTYAAAGEYVVKFLSGGIFGGIRFNDSSDSSKLLETRNWGDLVWQSFQRAFHNCDNHVITASDAPEVSGVESFEFAFFNNDLTSFPLIDTSSVTSFRGAWSGCNLTSFPLIDTSSATNLVDAWRFNDLGVASWSALLIDIEANNPNDNVILHGGGSKYSTGAAATARAALVARGWTITDGGPA